MEKNTRAARIPHSIYISKAIRNSEARLHKKNLSPRRVVGTMPIAWISRVSTFLNLDFVVLSPFFFSLFGSTLEKNPLRL